MYTINMNETIHTLAAFRETFDLLDWLEELVLRKPQISIPEEVESTKQSDDEIFTTNVYESCSTSEDERMQPSVEQNLVCETNFDVSSDTQVTVTCTETARVTTSSESAPSSCISESKIYDSQSSRESPSALECNLQPSKMVEEENILLKTDSHNVNSSNVSSEIESSLTNYDDTFSSFSCINVAPPNSNISLSEVNPQNASNGEETNDKISEVKPSSSQDTTLDINGHTPIESSKFPLDVTKNDEYHKTIRMMSTVTKSPSKNKKFIITNIVQTTITEEITESNAISDETEQTTESCSEIRELENPFMETITVPVTESSEINETSSKESIIIQQTYSISEDVDSRIVGPITSTEISETDTESSSEILRMKKYATSALNLVSLLESLYTIQELPTFEESLDPELRFQRTVIILSRGAFLEYPEDYYFVSLEGSSLFISQEDKTLFALPLKYGEVYVIDEKILMLDNKLGRCIYMKFDSVNDLRECKAALEYHFLAHWQSECLKIVHYPLKCHQNVIIIDLGSCSTRAGILMDQPTLPSIFFPTVCATNKLTGEKIYGMEALSPEVRHNSNLSFPVRPSAKIAKFTMDVESLGGLFKKVFQMLQVDPSPYTVQLCVSRSLSIATQKALLKLLLEDLNVNAVSITCQALLTLYAHDVKTAVVVDVGDRMDIVPVIGGFIVETGITRLPYGGQRIIHHMKHALAEKHISLSNDIDSFVVRYINENLAYVAENYNEELVLCAKHPEKIRKNVTLAPFVEVENKSVKSVSLEAARFSVPEGLFNPDLWGLDNPGIHVLVQKAIQASGLDFRKEMAESIYVSGGVTMMPGFVERLTKEVSNLSTKKLKTKVFASNYRYHCTYIGACKFARLQEFPAVCVNYDEYSKDNVSVLKKFLLCY